MGLESGDVIEIRAAHSNDSEAAAEMVFGILRAYGIEPDPAHLDREVVLFGANDPKCVREFSAFCNGQLVGVCTLKFADRSRPIVTALYVDPRIRRRGIGRKLLKAAIEAARSLGFSRLELETRTAFKEAVQLYETSGWVRGPNPPPGYGPDRIYTLDL